MSTTTSSRALLVIDVQQEYDAAGALPIEFPPFEQSLAQVTRAMDIARAADIPVVVVQQDAPAGSPIFALGSPGWQLQPEVAQRPRDLLVHKNLPGAFTGTSLEDWLRGRSVDTLTLVGYMTQHCVSTTARQASHSGFTVEVLSDATGTLAYSNTAGDVGAREMHEAHLAALHGGFAGVGTLGEWTQAIREDSLLRSGNPLTSRAGHLAQNGSAAE